MAERALVIQTNKVSKIYKKLETPVVALRDVSISIYKGEFVAIVGSSGSGKSTLLHILGALDQPTSGIYTLNGEVVSLIHDDELSRLRRTQIGFVFQVFNLIHQLHILDNVALPLRYDGVDEVTAIRKAKESLKRVGLEDRLFHKPSELSGGECQRAAIARALAIDPVVLLADEPTGNLDSESGNTILSLFEELRQEGHTIIVVTHDDGVANRADRIVTLRDGSVSQRESAL